MVSQRVRKNHIFEGSSPGVSPGACEPRIEAKLKMELAPITAYATLYTIKKGKRVTLAIRGVRWQDTKVCILTCLLAELSSLKIKVKRLYLDWA